MDLNFICKFKILFVFRYPPGYFVQEFTFDFFNYAGIHRPVKLYTTPAVYLSDITITTSHSNEEGIVNFHSTVSSSAGPVNVSMKYEIIDKAGTVVASAEGPDMLDGKLMVKNPELWWPVGMSDQPAYLYSLKVLKILTVFVLLAHQTVILYSVMNIHVNDLIVFGEMYIVFCVAK